MAKYIRITAYHPEHNISVILDSNGRFSELWEFSAYLVSKGFNIIEIGKDDNLIEESMASIKTPSNKLLLRGIGKGRPEISTMTYQERNCRIITVYDRLYGQFIY